MSFKKHRHETTDRKSIETRVCKGVDLSKSFLLWCFQPTWKIWVRGSNHPQVRVENKHIRNHHLGLFRSATLVLPYHGGKVVLPSWWTSCAVDGKRPGCSDDHVQSEDRNRWRHPWNTMMKCTFWRTHHMEDFLGFHPSISIGNPEFCCRMALLSREVSC